MKVTALNTQRISSTHTHESFNSVKLETQNILDNLKCLQKMNLSDFFCAMIKDNAYGHGLIKVASLLEEQNVERFGVNSIQEAIKLRQSGIKTPILVFGSHLQTSPFVWEDFQLTPVVGSFDELMLLHKATKSPLPIHISLNSGMNRLEFPLTEVSLRSLKSFFKTSSTKLHLEGICTHSAFSEDLGSSKDETTKELTNFLDKANFLSKTASIHALRTASLLALSLQNETNLLKKLGARVGGGLYGLAGSEFYQNPILREKTKKLLKPALTLHSRVVCYQKLKKGEPLSYNRSWKAPRDSVIAIVPFGYAHGFLRPHHKNYEALFRSQRVPLVGQVNMDFLYLDLTDLKACDLKTGEQVTLLGEGLRVEEIAQRLDTIAYDILVQIHPDIPR